MEMIERLVNAFTEADIDCNDMQMKHFHNLARVAIAVMREDAPYYMERIAAAEALSFASDATIDQPVLVVAALENADVYFVKMGERNDRQLAPDCHRAAGWDKCFVV